MNDFENTITTTGDVIVAELVETGTLETGTMLAGTDVATLAPPSAGFDNLVSTRDSGTAPEQLVTSLRPTVFEFGDRPERARLRPGVGDWSSLVLAVIAPPIGLILSIIVRVTSWRRTGWTSGVVRTATVLGSVFTILVVVGGIILSSIAGDAAKEAKIAADSAPLCAALAETPGVLESPAFGWPTEQGTLAITLEQMKAYQLRWQGLADVAPAEIRAGVSAVANAAQTLITSVETNRSIDRAGNLAAMDRVTSQTALRSWAKKYCS